MNKIIKLNLRYKTDPERIRRVLPPPLEPDEEAIAFVDYALLEYDEAFRNIFIPGPYYESGFHVSAKYRGKSGVFQVGMPLNHDWGRTMGRDYIGYHKKDGVVSIEIEGNTVKANLWRRGIHIHSTETVFTENIAHPKNWFREFGYGAYLYRFRLNPDWRQGTFSDGPVELWRLGGNEFGYPTDVIEGEGLPLVCDLKHTKFSFIEPSLLDPFCEFLPEELLSVTYHAAFWEGLVPPQIPVRPGSAQEGIFGPSSTFLETVDKKIFEPWAIIGHDRPISRGKISCPVGWPYISTALKLTPRELENYHTKEHLSLSPITAIDIELEIAKDTHSRMLPPECECENIPLIRILGLIVKTSDISPLPFNELWLCSQCEVNGKKAYYLLSHIVDSGGDVIYGRETFGYPSKMGSVKIDINGNNIIIHGNRLDRDFFHCTAVLSPEAILKKEDKFEVLGIQMQPFKAGQEPSAELIIQPWEIKYKSCNEAILKDVKIDFPKNPAPGIIGYPDPWFEFQSCKVNKLSVFQGELYRKPAKRLEKLTNPLPYYIERYDSIFDLDMDKLIDRVVSGSKASFLIQD